MLRCADAQLLEEVDHVPTHVPTHRNGEMKLTLDRVATTQTVDSAKNKD